MLRQEIYETSTKKYIKKWQVCFLEGLISQSEVSQKPENEKNLALL